MAEKGIICDRTSCQFNENGKCSSMPEIDENGLCKEVDVDVSSLVEEKKAGGAG